jgi:putative DNA methylase
MKKKLIEVALPLEAINREAAREKSIRHGHPSTLHLWWARRPLAACRAVIFGSLVDDPSSHPDKFPTVEAQEKERKRLFDIIERMVKWENSNNEHVLKEVRDEILKSTNGNPPPIYDPFCGGGSIPLEAQRLGLKAYGSDLNPVAVLITKALIEIPPKFAGMAPVNPEERGKPIKTAWRSAQGLAADVRYYGKWMRDEAEKRIGKYYPKVQLPKDMGGGEAMVIAWIWARTVKCPNPACGAQMPLLKSFWLSTKKGKEAWIEPIIDRVGKRVSFEVRTGKGEPPASPKVARGAKFKCLCCDQVAPEQHIKDSGTSHQMGQQLMAIVAEGAKGRVYLSPSADHAKCADFKKPENLLEEELPFEPRAIWCTLYGLKQYRDLFTARQLVALKTFSDLVSTVREQVLRDAEASQLTKENIPLEDGGFGLTAYADAVSTYLAFAVDKGANYWSSLCAWHTGAEKMMSTFARQALPMTWDFTEVNPFCDSSGNFMLGIDQAAKSIMNAITGFQGEVKQVSATDIERSCGFVICTDPPYYDNIGYADLSDFFYVWLKRSLSQSYKKLFSTFVVPKTEELVASPYRFEGSKDKARDFFEKGLSKVFSKIHECHLNQFPLSVFYAFKQSESDEESSGDDESISTASTGWETMLEGLINSGFVIVGTYPMRTELTTSLKKGVSALASSIVINCRHRDNNAPITTRREFINSMKAELPASLEALKQANIAATDLAQAAIGPGMAIFSRYSKVMESDGSSMSVRTALALINQVLDEVNTEGEGDFDPDSRWAVSWFETHGFEEGAYGEAETLSKAKNTSTSGLVEAGVITSKAGKVKLIPIESLPEDWNPKSDSRLTVWEVTHHLIRVLETKGEEGAATLMKEVGSIGEVARDLAYRLYSICERKKWAKDALRYNGLIISWGDISKQATASTNEAKLQQQSSFNYGY